MSKQQDQFMGDRLRWGIVIAAVALIGGLWIWASSVPASATTSGDIPSPRKGFAAPDFTLTGLNSEEIHLADLRGQAVVINMWASWCPPCRAEMPALQRVYEANKDRGLVVLAVNTTYQDTQSAAVDFVEQRGLTFPVLFDITGDVSNQYLVRAMPTTFFVGRDGVIDQVVVGGPMSEATIRAGVEEALEEGP